MLTAGLAFAIVNSFAQIASIHFGVSSTTFALFQYAIALFVILPYLRTLGIRRSLRTQHFGWHAFVFSLCYRYPTVALGARLPCSDLARHCAANDFSSVCDRRLRAYLERESGHSTLACHTNWLYRCHDHLRTVVRLLHLGNSTACWGGLLWAAYSLMVKRCR